MPKDMNQIVLLMLFVAPGYLSYTLKQRWLSHREKQQFGMLLNSLIYSLIIWMPFVLYNADKGSNLRSIINNCGYKLLWIIPLIVIWAAIISAIEKSGLVFRLSNLLKLSTKAADIPPLEHALTKYQTFVSIEVQTKDGFIYKGFNKKKGDVKLGTYPYNGDVLMKAHYIKTSDGKEKNIKESELTKQGYTMRTYIPKENISSLRFYAK